MSLVHLANFSAHIKNCTRLNISSTSVPFTRLHLQLSFLLYKEGFISSVQRGSNAGPDKTPAEVTPDNISSRRLWIGLKYRDNLSVIRNFSLVSKPNRKVHFTSTEIKALASGIPVGIVRPLQPAECMFIQTDESEILEVQEAAKKNLGGTVLCRVR
ncbi:hypothetical protein PSN45_004597 [Yamadazyma tenuis]|uniref:Small ribosomal subunit protein uS8m n=1 Tax=Candida tenuis (strain ATCC 10573 / BCRC 21748 / CBS 615 / JCM 9827 / NBRC 10315 / NRRL Y-1498 / VKM Y-70) TaxID=590646 RepID=G3B544_CANTC|nr:ribosomal protein S8 [Yamadazyma tenuis ATCC 10573]EGV63136.1 ribosomal protein S8 [Yamadazyma tenuis ATCC 10573]WEJ97050.1 hypothetical protein PSN45_004597 [Yamadazyma tenuis]